jgi:hypothetical protein
MFPPPYTPPAALLSQLRGHGHAVLEPEASAALCGTRLADLQALAPSWDDLPPDTYLRDAGHYRRRRHSCYVVDADGVQAAPHRAHWQSLDYNALHGGMQRWFVEAHQFRIDTAGGIGRPTPEGAHRDGVDFVAVFLVAREGIKGGETRVFVADGPDGQRFTLTRPWSLLLLDDARVIHESTPITPEQRPGDEGIPAPAHRDTLVLTFRAGGFQGDAATIAG